MYLYFIQIPNVHALVFKLLVDLPEYIFNCWDADADPDSGYKWCELVVDPKSYPFLQF